MKALLNVIHGLSYLSCSDNVQTVNTCRNKKSQDFNPNFLYSNNSPTERKIC